MSGCELASKVSLKEPIFRGDPDSELKVAVIDCGCKKSVQKHSSTKTALKILPATVEVLNAGTLMHFSFLTAPEIQLQWIMPLTQ